MKKIFNGTPHEINIINRDTVVFNESIRKYTSDKPEIITTIPKNYVLSAQIATEEDGITETALGEIPTFKKKVVGCDSLPEDYDIIIVSALYAHAAKLAGYDTTKLYTVSDPVYSTDGKTILGCLGICPVF